MKNEEPREIEISGRRPVSERHRGHALPEACRLGPLC